MQRENCERDAMRMNGEKTVNKLLIDKTGLNRHISM